MKIFICGSIAIKQLNEKITGQLDEFLDSKNENVTFESKKSYKCSLNPLKIKAKKSVPLKVLYSIIYE